jgi:ribonuclease HI
MYSVPGYVTKFIYFNSLCTQWARKLLADVEATGRTVHWVHVKGHSAGGGNDRADELVQ